MNEEIEKKLLSSVAGPQWKKIGVRHHHGFCIPLFSLHSKKSCGIGEFPDLIELVAFCKEVGFDVIQLLPLNDTGLETSPYSALSAFALNPLHLGIAELPLLELVPHYREKLAQIQKWTHTPRVRYHLIRELRYAFLKQWFDVSFEEISKLPSYQAFVESNHGWLKPYALFKALKEKTNWRSWEDWPSNLKAPSDAAYSTLLAENATAVHFQQVIQYFCFEQFENVKRIAEENGVFIKGDIPILINRDSADVWHRRQFFLLNLAAGAPPDMYTKQGQYWGFPIYDWEALEKHNYSFWEERLKLASHLYHLYRIDHVVGFFRLWAIPLDHPATEGFFIPQAEETWIPHGKKLMEMMLKAAPILPIGEDLGLVPDTVKHCLSDLGICGTKMMRWEKDFSEGGTFFDPASYSPESMTTVSTHDSDTLQLWWKHFPKEAKQYADYKKWGYQPFLSLERHLDILKEAHHTGSLFHINLLQEYLALFPPLVSSHPTFERINIPGKILPTNWTYRFRPSVEELLDHSDLKKTLINIIS